jgi:hypothetical protein
MVGRNNAKYFDRNGWLFFTKERFDLLYPSYGDTYPMYNGAIGMTFEQGGISAGLAVRTQDGDTLRLADRIMHHFTTGMSTIEVSARHAGELVQEFRKYFSPERIASVGEYRSYVVLADAYGERIGKIRELLDRNRIEWSLAPTGTYTGVNIETGKTEECHSRSGDIVINTNQPKASLIKVLFDRNARISDSATYDITAWSLPMVYDLEVVGLNHPIKGVDPSGAADPGDPSLSAAYAYAVRWTGVRSARFLAALLRQGIKVRFSEQPFATGKENFERGTLLITSTGNRQAVLPAALTEAAQRTGVRCFPIESGLVDKGYDLGSNRIHMIHPPRIAVFAGEGVSGAGAGEVWYFFEQEIEYPVTLINSTSADQLNWQNYDVVILPDGNYKFLNDRSSSEPIRNWVAQGGRLIAMENAVAQLARNGWGLKPKDTGEKKRDSSREIKTDYSALKIYADRDKEELSKSTPGSIFRVDLDNTHPLAFGYPGYYYSLRLNDDMYDFLGDNGWNLGVIRKDNFMSGFAGSRVKEKLKDGLVFGVQQTGRGKVIYMDDDPLFRNFWENGKLLFANAVFMVGE